MTSLLLPYPLPGTGAIFRDRRRRSGVALATLGRSGAVMAKPAGQDTPNAPSDAAPVRKETLTTRKLGSLEVSAWDSGACRWWVITAEVARS